MTESVQAAGPSTATLRPPVRERGSGGPSAIELLILALAFLTGTSVVLLIAWYGLTDGRQWSGSAGGVIEDTMQYLAFIRQSVGHLTTGNLFRLEPPSNAYLHPGIAISGLLVQAGMSVPLSYAIWVPAAAFVLCAGAFLFVREAMPKGPARAVALALGLLYCLPDRIVQAFPHPEQFGQISFFETTTLNTLRGYPFSALSVAAILMALTRFARLRAQGSRIDLRLALLSLAIGWLQPWEGAVFCAALATVEIALLRTAARPSRGVTADAGGRRDQWNAMRRLTVPSVALAAAPLAYYWLLAKVDSSFHIADLNAAPVDAGQTWWTLLLAVTPLGVPALLALRFPIRSPIDAVTRAWPFAAVAVACVVDVTGVGIMPAHCLRGVAIPLAVLAVTGIDRSIGHRRGWGVTLAAAASLVVLCGVGTVKATTDVHHEVSQPTGALTAGRYWVGGGNDRALAWLARDGREGGVVASPALAALVPSNTGRSVWAGNPIWTPSAMGRLNAGNELFSGRRCCSPLLVYMPASRFAQATGARFALVECSPISKFVVAELRPAAIEEHRLGCATVLELRPGTTADRSTIEEFYPSNP